LPAARPPFRSADVLNSASDAARQQPVGAVVEVEVGGTVELVGGGQLVEVTGWTAVVGTDAAPSGSVLSI
jgi:hypothetical protein